MPPVPLGPVVDQTGVGQMPAIGSEDLARDLQVPSELRLISGMYRNAFSCIHPRIMPDFERLGSEVKEFPTR